MSEVQYLDQRLRRLIESKTKSTRRNAEMEALTEIAASQWASWWAGRARPSSEMVVAVCSVWPECALWLVTGSEDRTGGQISPDTDPAEVQEPAVRYLRRLVGIKQLHSHEDGNNLSEWEVDELNALSKIRIRELYRRIAGTVNGNKED